MHSAGIRAAEGGGYRRDDDTPTVGQRCIMLGAVADQ
jgi:hypothetical protein